MNEQSIQLGGSFSIGGISFIHPTIRNVLEYGEENFVSAINLFLLKPSDLMVQLDDMDINYEELEQYDIFSLLCGEIQSSKSNGEQSKAQKKLGWLTSIYDFDVHVDEGTGEIYLKSESSNLVIDKASYFPIRRYFLKMTFRSDKEKYAPANETTRKAIIDQERKRQKRSAKKKHGASALESQISSLVWGNTSGYKYEDVLDLPMYQFYDGIFRLNKIKIYNNNMFGYYSGNMSSENIKKNEDDIDWMGPIIP